MVTDQRRYTSYHMDNAVVDEYGAQVGVYGVAVYNVLARMAAAKGECFPAVATIAHKLGCSENKVRHALKALERAGLIAIIERNDEDGQRSNRYVLLSIVAPQSTTPNPQSETPKGTLYERTIGRVLAAEGRSQIGVLVDVWRDVFGQDIAYSTAQELVNLVHGKAEAVAQAMIGAVGYHGIVDSPYAAVKRSLEYKVGKGATNKQPRTSVPARGDRPLPTNDTGVVKAKPAVLNVDDEPDLF